MARLGDIAPLRRPVDVVVRESDGHVASPFRWTVGSLDLYGAANAPRTDDRVVFASDDLAAVLAFLEADGYIAAGDDGAYRLHDETCGACGAFVPPVARERHAEGWSDGREYRRFGGRLQILRVRCPAHPFDVEDAVRALSEAGLL